MIRPPGCWLLWLCEAALIRGLGPKAADRVRRHLPAKLSQWERATWWWMWMMIAVTSSFDSELMSLYMFIYIIYIYIYIYYNIHIYVHTNSVHFWLLTLSSISSTSFHIYIYISTSLFWLMKDELIWRRPLCRAGVMSRTGVTVQGWIWEKSPPVRPETQRFGDAKCLVFKGRPWRNQGI